MIGASQCIQVAVIKCGQVCILCAIIYHMKHCFLCVCEFMMLETPKRRHYCHLLAVFLSDTLAITRCNCLLACMHSCTRSCSVGFCRWIADDVCEYIFQFHGSTLQPAGLFSLVLRLVQSSLGGQFPGTRHHLVKMIIIALSSYTLFFVPILQLYQSDCGQSVRKSYKKANPNGDHIYQSNHSFCTC